MVFGDAWPFFKGRGDSRLGFGLVDGSKRPAEDGPAAMRQVLPPHLHDLHIASLSGCLARCGAHIYTGAATCPPLSCTKKDKSCAVPVLHMLEASCNSAGSARHCGTVSEPCACTSVGGISDGRPEVQHSCYRQIISGFPVLKKTRVECTVAWPELRRALLLWLCFRSAGR